MALLLTKGISIGARASASVVENCLSVVSVSSAIQKSALRSIYDRNFISGFILQRHQLSGVWPKQYQDSSLQHFSTSIQHEKIAWGGSTSVALLKKLEIALKDNQVDEAWEVFNDYKRLYGLPEQSLVNKLITELSYSSKSQWLEKASDLVLLILKEKRNFLQLDALIKLSLSLARAQMPIPASRVLWLMLVRECLPPLNVLSVIFLHMVKKDIGFYLASNLLIEICNNFQRLSASKSNCVKLTKPDTLIFNLVLDACVRFGSPFKGQQIIELMPQVGVVADAHSIVIIARIHEMNGQRDEIKKFKDHVDKVSVPFIRHYRQFYDSLLSLHFMFNDIDAVSALVLYMYQCWKLPPVRNDRRNSQKPCLVPIGSHYLRTGLKMEIAPELLRKDYVLKIESKEEFVLFKSGKLVLTTRGLAKLICLFKRSGKIAELSKLLLTIQNQLCTSGEYSLCSDVIEACVHLGWLETAHDILDDMELVGSPMRSTVYVSLLKTYYEGKMFREAEALLKQMRKVGFVISMDDEMVISRCSSEAEDKNTLCAKESSSTGTVELAEFFLREIQEEQGNMPAVIYECNSSIYFFCKAKMIDDAVKTYRKMQEAKVQPTMQTFAYLVYGYSSWKMYRDITILWGEMKRNLESGNLVINRDLFEFLLLNFLRGGYFERVMEVIGYMEANYMHTDKFMYKNEFLKLHRDLYRRLKASKAKTDAQSKRLEFVRAFRKWVAIN